MITVPSSKPKPKASGGTKSGSSGTTSTKRRAGGAAAGAAAAAGAKKKSKPQFDDDLDFEDDDLEFEDDAGGGYDEYGEDDYDDGGYDDYGDDDYDDYEPAPKKRPSKSSRSGGSKSKSKSSKSKAKAKPAKKKKSSGGGVAVGFNLNRINIALCVGGVLLFVLGVKESILSGKANAEPTQMSLQELISNGVGDNIHLTLTGVDTIIEETVVYGDQRPGGDITNYDKVWIPAAAEGGDGSVKLIIKSTNAKNDAAVRGLGSKTTHSGLIVNDIESISGEERQLLSTVPGVNMDAVYIFHESRTPSGAGMLILYFAGGLVLLAGGLFWIFLVR